MKLKTLKLNRVSALNAVAYLLFLTTALFLYLLTTYYIPRDVVDVRQPVEIDKLVYAPGETVRGDFIVENKVDSFATFKRLLICKSGGNEVQFSLSEITNFPVKKSPVDRRVVTISIIPDEIAGKRCRIDIVAIYTVSVNFLLTRDYSYTISTAEFEITNGELPTERNNPKFFVSPVTEEDTSQSDSTSEEIIVGDEKNEDTKQPEQPDSPEQPQEPEASIIDSAVDTVQEIIE